MGDHFWPVRVSIEVFVYNSGVGADPWGSDLVTRCHVMPAAPKQILDPAAIP